MGFLAFCLLFWFVGYTIWNPIERNQAIREAKEKPLVAIFMVAVVLIAAMFFFGIFIPVFGLIEIGKTGWHVWSVGGVGFFGLTGFLIFLAKS